MSHYASFHHCTQVLWFHNHVKCLSSSLSQWYTHDLYPNYLDVVLTPLVALRVKITPLVALRRTCWGGHNVGVDIHTTNLDMDIILQHQILVLRFVTSLHMLRFTCWGSHASNNISNYNNMKYIISLWGLSISCHVYHVAT